MLSNETLENIKNDLPSGALVEIKKDAGVSYQTVLNFFNSKSKNIKVMKSVIKYRKKYKSVLDQLKK